MRQQELNWLEERPVLTVSELVQSVKISLEGQFRGVWVQGEVSNFKRPPSGHVYFTLKDSDAQIRAVCFRVQNRLLRFEIRDGMHVIAGGSISVYPPRGDFQLIVETLEPLGKGALQLAFEQLKARLAAEGLFETARKRRLPLLPGRIGVVTSPSGAAIQDILRVLKRRNDRINVLIYPVKVQGEGAAREIAEGIRYFNLRDDIDVLIVGRGGGSLEDLWAFNEEIVARAIFASRVPVISAVGHEIDFTIADFVADLRAPTPSAAAELVAAARLDLAQQVEQLEQRTRHALRIILQNKRHRLDRLAGSRAFVDAESRLRIYLQRLDELQARLARTGSSLVEPRRMLQRQLFRDLGTQIRFQLQAKVQGVRTLERQLAAFSPQAVLERGYAIVTKADTSIVRDPAQVGPGEEVNVRVARGKFRAGVITSN